MEGETGDPAASELASEPRARTTGGLLLALGAALQLLFWSRPLWLYRDQVELYRLGMAFAGGGELSGLGKLMTGDWPLPGVLLQLLIGVPLRLWTDYRAPTLVIVVFHFAAGWILWRTLGRAGGERLAAIFLAVFWLSPWRLYHSGFLWEPAYLMLPAAVHLWACHELRERSRMLPSLLLGATLTLALQLHFSAVVPALATAVLLLHRRMRLRWPAALGGAALGALTILPTLGALLDGGPGATPGPALGLPERLGSLLRAAVYWLRFGSLDLGRRYRETVFCRPEAPSSVPGTETAAGSFLCGLLLLVAGLALLSILLAVAASWWYLARSQQPSRADAGLSESPRAGRDAWGRDPGARFTAAGWLRHYAAAMLVAVLAAALLSPILIQGWHLLIALPAACLPVAAWIDRRWGAAGPWLRTTIVVFLLLRLPAALLIAFGHPAYVAPATPEQQRHLAPEDLRPLLD